MNIKNELERPFPVDRLHFRVGATNSDKTSGIALAYIDARDVMKRLDESVGFNCWQCRYSHIGSVIICDIGLRLAYPDVDADYEWMWRSNGAGETAVEGEKGGCSDAFKRAAVMWGVGRYLYALPNIWVPVEQRGKSTTLPKESIEELKRRLPAWATPEGYDTLIEERKST